MSTASRDELVLVVPRELVVPGAGWRGVRPGGLEVLEAAVASAGVYLPRAVAEHDPSRKQVIPYLVLRDGQLTFLMRRTRAGGDPRLHDRRSIGIGGHLNPGDDGIAGGLAREWHEELVADFVPEYRFLGLLNDDDTDVGRVHLGAVFVADAGGRPVAVRETHKLEGRFAPATEVRAARPDMETWSQLAWDAIDRPEPSG
ncbi:MAG: hydrolase [Chloroflexi bacterium]|jgi:predicted NUDIX family phosphoesterase|nr:hydrolase [Chloroflexota bacterium]